MLSRWRLAEVAGRVVEISGAARLTAAFGLALEAQRQGEPVAWVTPEAESFYPPDVAETGADLGALVVVRVPDAGSVARAADRLVRSGAFGLVVLDLGTADVPTPLQARLAGLAQKHHTALLCLTEKKRAAPSLGSLVSLRVHAQRTRIGEDRFTCALRVLKDKRRGPTWAHMEECRGPAGLR
jgi:recombination protein RecA